MRYFNKTFFWFLAIISIIWSAYAIPTIILNGMNPFFVNYWDVFTDPWATRFDTDGSTWDIINATSWSINTLLLWAQLLEYSYTNGTWETWIKIRTVEVGDQTAPIITLSGSNSLTIGHNTIYTEQWATRTDNVDWTWFISTPSSGSVNTNTLWTYTLEYTYTDNAGNTWNTVTRTITVVDQTAPVITLSGLSSIIMPQNNLYTEQWATRTDNIDWTWFISTPSSGSVNTSTLWTYILEYTYTDNAGNTWNIVTRTITVVDQIAPVIVTWSAFINEWNNLTINSALLTNDINPIISYWFDINNNWSADFTNTSWILNLTRTQLQSFGISWNNTTLLPSDVYTIKITATDSSNNVWTGIYQLKVYNLAPVISITSSIISGKIYTWIFNIQRSITDPANQDFPMNTDVYYSNNNWATFIPIISTSSNRTWNYLWNTTWVTDGINYKLRVRSTDDYGNNAIISLPFKIDNSGPMISGQTNYTISEWSSLWLNINSTTDSIAWISWYVWNINGNLTWTTTWILNLSWSQLQSFSINNDGIYPLSVDVRDTVWNKSTKTINLTITNTSPTLTITQPTTGIYSGILPIIWTTNDVANWDLPLFISVQYTNWTYSGIITQATGLSSPYNLNTLSIPDGTWYTIIIKSSDDDSTTIRTWNVISIDNTIPIISWFLNTYTINESNWFSIDISSSKDMIAGLSWGSSQFTWTLNNIVLPTSTNWYRNFTRSSLASYGITNWSGQSYPISLTVTDAIGHKAIKTWLLIVNNIAPTIQIISPSTWWITWTWTKIIQRTQSDPIDTWMKITISYSTWSNGPWIYLWSWSSNSFSSLSRNTALISDSTYYIKATIEDDKDTVYTIRWPLIVDNIPNFLWWWCGSWWWCTSTPSWWAWGGGGWWGGSSSSATKDYCPLWDYTNNLYDGDCWTKPTTTTNSSWTTTSSGNQLTQSSWTTSVAINSDMYNTTIPNWYCYTRKENISIGDSQELITTREFKKWLAFLYSYSMTIFNNIDDFKPEQKLTREQAAKIFVNFATNVLCRKPDTSIEIQYNDIDEADKSLQKYIILAYQLDIMKWGTDWNFRPFEAITKAQVNAALIRMLLKWYLPEKTTPWYKEYSTVSSNIWITTQQVADSVAISRNDTALMMFRAYKNSTFSLQNIKYESFVLDNRNQYIVQ